MEQLTFEDMKTDFGAANGSGEWTERERQYLYWLSRAPAMGAVTIKKLWDRCRSFEAVYNMEEIALSRMGLLKENQAAGLGSWKRCLGKCREEYGALQEKGIRFVTFLEEAYPGRLKDLDGSPAVLYGIGRFPDEERPAAAIVGARDCSHYGRETAEALGKVLAEAGVQVISGMALGIDGAGLEAAVAEFNSAAQEGKEDVLLKEAPARALDAQGPYYGVRVEAANHMTKGGVSCNENAQVLYEDGTVVEGLYASGEVTWQSGGYSQSVCFGRVAGEQAVANLK